MKLHVIDGTFELFRAYHSRAPAYVGPNGLPAKATVGVIRSLLSLLHDPGEAGDPRRDPRRPGRVAVKVRGAKRLAETLRGGREDVFFYRKLARLVTDVPLQESLDDLQWPGVPRAEFHAWCDRFGLEQLADRPERWAGSSN